MKRHWSLLVLLLITLGVMLGTGTARADNPSVINKYPDITARVVKTVIWAAKLVSDNDATPTPVFQLWTKSGTPFSNYKEDYLENQSLKVRASPLIDDYVVSQYQSKIQDAKRYGLIKGARSWTAVESRPSRAGSGVSGSTQLCSPP